MVENLPQKILHYEEFLNECLRSDLNKVLSAREEVCSELAEYNQLKTTIELLISKSQVPSTSSKSLKTMVDLGCNFYAHAKVQDFSTIFVSVGLGFHLEMKLDEASAFIEERASWLTERASQLSEQAAEINGRIKLVMETLRELQFASPTTLQEHPHRDVW